MTDVIVARGGVYVTSLDRLELEWLARQTKPMWGAHLARGEPLNAPNMLRWMELGLIERVGMDGYQITPYGRDQLEDDNEIAEIK